ncbi:MAG: GIY-YIG nuclease family protein [Clostridiales Family XIII bacterium]|jgi:hypothetical protein|nr:GIY-YIG nuclease family protein [Clostridiales Family XIII bacterium]
MSEIVYILSNAAMPGLLKIGLTDKDDLSIRMKELYTTGVPVPFDCVYACIAEDNAKVEKAMHDKFAKQRLNPRREFFRLKAARAVTALKHYEIEDITTGFRSELDAPLTKAEKAARWEERHELEQIDPTVAEAKDLHVKVGNSV